MFSCCIRKSCTEGTSLNLFSFTAIFHTIFIIYQAYPSFVFHLRKSCTQFIASLRYRVFDDGLFERNEYTHTCIIIYLNFTDYKNITIDDKFYYYFTLRNA